jgi:hypothetical protein
MQGTKLADSRLADFAGIKYNKDAWQISKADQAK